MATPGFGFSAGDFIAGVSLVKKLIRALNDTAGSRAAYRKLITELLNLEDALTEINKLQFGQAQESQRLALKRVATQCEYRIEAFLQKNCKFNESLGSQSSVTPSAWRTNLHKIQWALCKDTAVDDLRTEIAAHTATLNVNLATIQVSATKLQEQRLENCTLLLQTVSDETREGNARSEENRQTLMVHTGLLQAISRHVTGLVFGTQEDGLLSLIRKSLQWNNRIFDAVTQMQQVFHSIPPQIEREQPVLFEDAHGRLTPFHIEFINSYDAFQAVLEARFDNMPGLRKVRNMEYAMQDTQSKQILDLSETWESSVRPGRKFVMSMVFQLPQAVLSSCPGCLTETPKSLVKEGSDIQCDNPDCRLFYRCITDVTKTKAGKRKRSDSHGSTEKRMKHRHEDNDTDDDDQDGIHDFRRVQIVHRGFGSSTERPTSSEGTTTRCIKDVYHNVYDNGETDITEQFHACRPGHSCSDPTVREYDRKISSRQLRDIDSRDLRFTDDISGADKPPMSISASQLDLGNAVRLPCAESTGLSPGWAPLSEYAVGIDDSITNVTSDSHSPLRLPPPIFVPIDGQQPKGVMPNKTYTLGIPAISLESRTTLPPPLPPPRFVPVDGPLPKGVMPHKIRTVADFQALQKANLIISECFD